MHTQTDRIACQSNLSKNAHLFDSCAELCHKNIASAARTAYSNPQDRKLNHHHIFAGMLRVSIFWGVTVYIYIYIYLYLYIYIIMDRHG
jgi:hypothetical protein